MVPLGDTEDVLDYDTCAGADDEFGGACLSAGFRVPVVGVAEAGPGVGGVGEVGGLTVVLEPCPVSRVYIVPEVQEYLAVVYLRVGCGTEKAVLLGPEEHYAVISAVGRKAQHLDDAHLYSGILALNFS